MHLNDQSRESNKKIKRLFKRLDSFMHLNEKDVLLAFSIQANGPVWFRSVVPVCSLKIHLNERLDLQ